MKVIKKRHDTQMHFFFNFDFITAAVWQLIFAQMTFAIDRPRSTVGLNAKKPAKNLNLNFLKLSYHSSACNSLTNFEDQVWNRKLQGVPHIHENLWHGFHYHGFWLMYLQWGNFCINRGLTTVPLTQISCNTVFSKSLNVRKAGNPLNSIHV